MLQESEKTEKSEVTLPSSTEPLIREIAEKVPFLQLEEDCTLSPAMSNLELARTLVQLIEKAKNNGLVEEIKKIKLPPSHQSLELVNFGKHKDIRREKENYFILKENNILNLIKGYFHFTISSEQTSSPDPTLTESSSNKIRITLGKVKKDVYFSLCDKIHKILVEEKLMITYKVRYWDSYERHQSGQQDNWELTGKDITIYAYHCPDRDWQHIISTINKELEDANTPKGTRPFSDLPLTGGFCAVRNDSLPRKREGRDEKYIDVNELWKLFYAKIKNVLDIKNNIINVNKDIEKWEAKKSSTIIEMKKEGLYKNRSLLEKDFKILYSDLFNEQFKKFYLEKGIVKDIDFPKLPDSLGDPKIILLLYDMSVQHNLIMLFKADLNSLDKTILTFTDIDLLKERRKIIEEHYFELKPESVNFSELKALAKILMPKFKQELQLELKSVTIINLILDEAFDLLEKDFFTKTTPHHPISTVHPIDLLGHDIKLASSPQLNESLYDLAAFLEKNIKKDSVLQASISRISKTLKLQHTQLYPNKTAITLFGHLQPIPKAALKDKQEQKLLPLFKEEFRKFYSKNNINQDYLKKTLTLVSEKFLVIYDLVIQDYMMNNPSAHVKPEPLAANREIIKKIARFGNIAYEDSIKLINLFSSPPILLDKSEPQPVTVPTVQ